MKTIKFISFIILFFMLLLALVNVLSTSNTSLRYGFKVSDNKFAVYSPKSQYAEGDNVIVYDRFFKQVHSGQINNMGINESNDFILSGNNSNYTTDQILGEITYSNYVLGRFFTFLKTSTGVFVAYVIPLFAMFIFDRFDWNPKILKDFIASKFAIKTD